MRSRVEQAAASRDIEIETEAVRLIEAGSAPWVALRKAARIVDERRQKRAADAGR